MTDAAAPQEVPSVDLSLDALPEFRRQLRLMLGTDQLADDDPKRHEIARESEWLKLVYEQNWALIQGDMDRAWSVLQIFVPFSIGPFAALAALSSPDRSILFALATASVATLVAGNLMVDRIKQHERRTWGLVRAIEAEIGLGGLGEGWRLTGGRLRGVRFRHVRWSLLALVTLAWLVLIATA